MRQTIKQFRNHCLSWLWALQGGKILGANHPFEAKDFDSWRSKDPDGRVMWERTGLSDRIPQLPCCGNWEAIEPTLNSLPLDLRAAYLSEIHKPWQLDFPNERVVEITGGRALSNLGIVLSSDGIQLNDLSGGCMDRKSRHPLKFSVGTLPPLERLPGRAVLLSSGLGQRNFYHWTTEMMPKMRLIQESGIDYQHVLVPTRHRYHRESILSLGVPVSKIYPMRKYGHIQADALVVTNLNRQELSSQNARYLFDAMSRQPWSKTKSTPRLRIYIGRRKKGWRVVVNERELMKSIEPLGFQRVYLEDLSFVQQVRLFQQAEFVIGPHGSGLVNLVYCNEGTRVIEIGTPVRPSVLFHVISCHRSLQYQNYFGTAVDAKLDESHIHVDIKALLATIQS